MKFSFIISLLVLLAMTACSSTKNSSEKNTSGVPDSESSEIATVNQNSQNSDEKEKLEALYWQRIQESKMNFTEADVKFMSGMIGHHAQALIMSQLAPENGASPEVQTLAARIINAQEDEIKIMQDWLRDRNQPVPEVHIDGLNLMIHGAGHAGHMDMESGMMDHSSMVGMLSPEQLIELSEAQGEEFDRLFLKYMIQHHSGAIVMVDELIATDGAAQDEAAFKIASEINVDQTTEIERMRILLLKLTGDISDM